MNPRPLMSLLAGTAFLISFMACSQAADEAVTSEELMTVVQEALTQAREPMPPAGPTADEIRAIVRTELGAEAASTVNGQCSSTLNGCDAGSFSNLDDTPEDYRWECLGDGNGSNATCSKCKSSNDPSGVARCGAELNSCVNASFSNVEDTPEYYRWRCLGDGNGSNVTCSKPKTGN